MLKKPVIKLRDLKELQSSEKQKPQHDDFITPFKVRKPRMARTSGSTIKKTAEEDKDKEPTAPATEIKDEVVAATPKTATGRRNWKSARKEPPPSQLRINTFFKTCEKSYKIEPLKEQPPTPFTSRLNTEQQNKTKSKSTNTAKKLNSSKIKRKKGGRKRLFVENEEDTLESDANEVPSSNNSSKDPEWKPSKKRDATKVIEEEECITIISDSEEEDLEKENNNVGSANKNSFETTCSKTSSVNANKRQCGTTIAIPRNSPTSTQDSETPLSTSRRKPKVCPPYKVVEGTTFAVDAFQYGRIDYVTDYFLTHFHADHYVGLTRKFAMPLYMSKITASLVRKFIPIDEQYIHELELNTPIVVKGVEIVALDANHCPGAIMLVFKIPTPKRCILHTGDFRAWHGMESEPIFWNNDIHTLYLDTTYISDKYNFSTQYESISRALLLTNQFRQQHAGKRILYVCGSYVIGKEKFWTAIAEEYGLKVWTEPNRRKALMAMNIEEYTKFLVDDEKEADMHILAMGKLSYLTLVEHFSNYKDNYDVLLALRPSGWEKNAKPSYGKTINLIGIEYSEHSSYKELERFVKFLKPEKVISTVPTGRDLMKTAYVPTIWYKYKTLKSTSNYQPRIEQYMAKTPQKKMGIRLPNEKNGGLEKFVSPIKDKTRITKKEINNNQSKSITPTKEAEENVKKLKITQKLNENNKQQIKSNEKTLKSPGKNATKPIIIEPNCSRQKKTLLSKKSLEKKEICKVFVAEENSLDYFEEKNLEKNFEQKEQNTQKTDNSSNSSSVLFEPPHMEKIKKQCNKNCLSSPIQEIPVSQMDVQQEQQDVGTIASTMSEDELQTLLKSTKDIQNMSKKDNKLNDKSSTDIKTISPVNPILKSFSNSGTLYHDSNEFDNSIGSEKLENECNDPVDKNNCIPSSQTTSVLLNTPRPLRNRIQYRLSQIPEHIPASQTTADLAMTPRLLRNKWQEQNDNEFIPASQTSKDLANTPRPIRNKKRPNTTDYSTSAAVSPPKRLKDIHNININNKKIQKSKILEKDKNNLVVKKGSVTIQTVNNQTLAQQRKRNGIKHTSEEKCDKLKSNTENCRKNNNLQQKAAVFNAFSENTSYRRCTLPRRCNNGISLSNIQNLEGNAVSHDTLDLRFKNNEINQITGGFVSPIDLDAADDWIE